MAADLIDRRGAVLFVGLALGAFAPDGLLGAGLQTTPWLNEFWFLGLPSAVIAYVQLKNTRPISRSATGFAVLMTATVVFALTCALLWLTTHGGDFLPPIMSDPVHPQLSWHFLPLIVLSLVAMALLWSRRQSSLHSATAPRRTAR